MIFASVQKLNLSEKIENIEAKNRRLSTSHYMPFTITCKVRNFINAPAFADPEKLNTKIGFFIFFRKNAGN